MNEFINSLNIKCELSSIYEFEIFFKKKIDEIKASITETILLSTAISILIDGWTYSDKDVLAAYISCYSHMGFKKDFLLNLMEVTTQSSSEISKFLKSAIREYRIEF